MASEIYLLAKTDLISALKNRTMAGANVTGGRTIPLDNPFSDYVAPDTAEKFIIVQIKKVQYDSTGDRGQHAQFKRIVDIQIDGYMQQDYLSADANNIDVQEQQDNDLDLFCSQIMDVVTATDLFNAVTQNYHERRYADIYPEDIVKNEITNTAGNILGSVSLRCTVAYQQDRDFTTLADLEDCYNSIKNGADSTIENIVKLEV